ncbi:hypothetical protein D3C75_1113540 [compost metagenome]
MLLEQIPSQCINRLILKKDGRVQCNSPLAFQFCCHFNQACRVQARFQERLLIADLIGAVPQLNGNGMTQFPLDLLL